MAVFSPSGTKHRWPKMRKTNKRTHLNQSKGTATDLKPLPLALRSHKPMLELETTASLQNVALLKLDEYVTTVLDPEEQPEIKNEPGLM
jgi:hypothetical protein